MHRKKIVLPMLLLSLAVPFAGCGDDEPSDEKTETVKVDDERRVVLEKFADTADTRCLSSSRKLQQLARDVAKLEPKLKKARAKGSKAAREAVREFETPYREVAAIITDIADDLGGIAKPSAEFDKVLVSTYIEALDGVGGYLDDIATAAEDANLREFDAARRVHRNATLQTAELSNQIGMNVCSH